MVLPNDQYTVGWISALTTELVAAQVFLDELHGIPESVAKGDSNYYQLGRIGEHNVVLAVLPAGEYGTTSATSVAKDMLHSFPNIRVGLMVGIGGGAPNAMNDVRLGDVVVSTPQGHSGGVFQYDFGKTIQEKTFQHTGHLNQTPAVLLAAVNALSGDLRTLGNNIATSIEETLASHERLRQKYGQPDVASDRLYKSTFIHQHLPGQPPQSCIHVCGNEPQNLVDRPDRASREHDPVIFHGIIASANSLMKDALIRDNLSQNNGVLCFEMEAAGLMNHFPCLVVRGICDYSDTHKNDAWHGYAAMVAAAYTKALLLKVTPNELGAEQRLLEVVGDH
ncbi:ankyrin repeat domain-containing protein 50 [Diplodia corticola]|uniref:Ankyrin repeat domain-containing protein 50 n=1 Tax=Diplodia corticola TaxID=236234 RepID=A0A1J9QKW3_9PEZI|nr:ankyrin repeat domain-containing protein 50 [Diplodia corticola]OJD29112.1 ankyrin repeat domain-containing protein 50 [Diplodia corticola]